MNESIALLEEIWPGARSTSGGTTPRCPATSGARRPTRPGSATELGWEPQVSLADGRRAAMGVGVG